MRSVPGRVREKPNWRRELCKPAGATKPDSFGFRRWQEFQFSESGRNVEIWLRSVGWPPGGVKARFGGAFNAEEVCAPDRRRAEVERETAKRDGDLCSPYFRFFVDVGAAFHAGVRVGAFAMFDVEVNPKAVGA